MAYDESKDKVVKKVCKDKDSGIIMEIRSYDGGTPKLIAYRKVGKKDRVAQLFRLLPEEALDLAELLVSNAELISEYIEEEEEDEESEESEEEEEEEEAAK